MPKITTPPSVTVPGGPRADSTRAALSAIEQQIARDVAALFKDALELDAPAQTSRRHKAPAPPPKPAPLNPAQRQFTFVFDAGDHSQLSNIQLKGSFNKTTGAFDPNWGGGDTVPMKPLGDGRWAVTLPIQDDGQVHNWQWGVVADGPTGKGQWAVMGETPLSFDPTNTSQPTASYAPTTYTRMGAQRQPNGDLSFRFWAPDAQAVSAKVTDKSGQVERISMTKDANGVWSATVPGGFDRMVGSAYSYEITTSEGQVVDKPDPYARNAMGEQRGLGREYVDVRTGAECDPFFIQPDIAQQILAKYGSWDKVPADVRTHAISDSRAEMMRFEIDGEPNHDHANLVFYDDSGHQLTKSELLARLGGPIDPKMDPSLTTKLRGGEFNDLWSQNVADDGTIHLTNEGGTWTTFVNNPEKLVGLHYELQAYDKDAQGNMHLVGDTNGDGVLSDAERAASPENDPWSNVIDPLSGVSSRGSLITDDRFNFQNDNAPRVTDHSKWVIEQVHVGSFMGSAQNSHRSTFQDLQNKLSYFKSLGINTLELLPTNQVEGGRDWGYMGSNTFATESDYGFEDANGKWVSGTDALKRFVDEAHRQGLNVVNDVVYNHVGGVDNGLWNLDGKNNPYFNWSQTPGQIVNKDTPWGAMPAYDNPMVKQFFVDHAVYQVQDLHFDGLRFDFTQPIKQDGQGGVDGWNMLREINRQVHFYNPNVFTAAEQFDYDPAMTTPAQGNGAGGAGFDAQWYTEFQHRLVHDNGNPSLIQQAVSGQPTDMNTFMNLLTNPRGLSSWANGVTIISDHDEVGNGERTINVADNNATGLPPQYARNLDRLAAGIGFTSPGIPMFFQGDESMAQNTFKWGTPSTWDIGWDWQNVGPKWNWDQLTFNDPQKQLYERLAGLSPADRANDPGYQALSSVDRQVCDDLCAMSPGDRASTELNMERRQTFEFYQDAIKLRENNPAFDADAQVNRLYTNNNDSVMAYERVKGNSDFAVVASLNKNNLGGYQVTLPPGQWKECFNSDGARYGGGNFGNFGATLNGGNTPVNIPSGGFVVFQRVG